MSVKNHFPNMNTSPMSPTYRILHLEDVPTDAELAARELKKNFAIDHLVIDTEEAFVAALDSFNPDIILCDHSLPSFNSHEALKLVKKQGRPIPFILITATMSEEIAAGLIKIGADDYILKDRLKRLPGTPANCLAYFSAFTGRMNLKAPGLAWHWPNELCRSMAVRYGQSRP